MECPARVVAIDPARLVYQDATVAKTNVLRL